MKLNEKIEARKLRSERCSVKEIAKKIGVAKSSVSVWVRDIQLTEDQIKKLAKRNACNKNHLIGAKVNQEKAKERHLAFRKKGFEWAKSDEFFRLICALYWGEGDKYRNNQKGNSFGISNSDWSMIRLVTDWLSLKAKKEYRFSLYFYLQNGLDENTIKEWWTQKIPTLKNNIFGNSVVCKINRASQNKNVGKLPYGTARVQVHNTELFYNVMGGIDYLKNMGD